LSMVHTRAWPRISPSTKIYFRCHFRGLLLWSQDSWSSCFIGTSYKDHRVKRRCVREKFTEWSLEVCIYIYMYIHIHTDVYNIYTYICICEICQHRFMCYELNASSKDHELNRSSRYHNISHTHSHKQSATIHPVSACPTGTPLTPPFNTHIHTQIAIIVPSWYLDDPFR